MPDAEGEKRLRALKKKLAQIEKLIARGSAYTAEESQKVAFKGELEAEIAALESGAPIPAPEEAQEAAVAEEDVAKAEPAAALESGPPDTEQEEDGDVTAAPPPGGGAEAASARDGVDRCTDMLPRLLLEAGAEKRVKQLQKKLREIEKLQEKLHESGKIEKLQEEKVATLPSLLQELAELEAKYPAQLSNKERGALQSVGKSAKRSQEEATQNGKAEKSKKLDEDDAQEDEEEDEEETAREKEERKKAGKESKDLKTKRQQQVPATKGRTDEKLVSADAATWPEVKDVASSGMGGVDKGRQKTVLLVNQGKAGAPYLAFDRYMFRFNFLTRLELKLPAGVLGEAAFQDGFPGDMLDLVDLVLKENALTTLPPKLGRLVRLRSLDVSHNALTTLPDDGTWAKMGTSLECLDASFNQLTSIAPIAPLVKLSTLKVDGNKLASLEGVSWAKLKQLTAITAIGNVIEEIPEEIASVGETIETIDLSENRITVVPVAFCELKKLKEFGAAGNPIKDPKVVKYLEKGGKGLKELKVYLPKARTSKK